MGIHWNILDEERKNILPPLSVFAESGFYLAGGTGLALQLGHRDSIDFDFFKEGDFDTSLLISKLEDVFKEYKIEITQNEKNTISCVLNSTIQLSFFGFKYKTLKPFIETDYFKIASIEDIACMKFGAIMSRSLEKDYVDLYFILQLFNLKDLINLCKEKYLNIDSTLILKSLTYFDDIKKEPILFKENHEVSLPVIEKFLEQKVKEYFINL